MKLPTPPPAPPVKLPTAPPPAPVPPVTPVKLPPAPAPVASNFVPYQPPSSSSNCDTLQTFERIANLAVSTMKEIYGKGNTSVQQGHRPTGTQPNAPNKPGVTVQVTN